MKDLPLSARIYVTTVIVTASVLVVWALITLPASDRDVVIVLAATSIVLEFVSRLASEPGKARNQVGLVTTLPIALAAAIIAGPAAAVLVGAAGFPISRGRAIAPVKHFFNAGQFAISAFLASLVLANAAPVDWQAKPLVMILAVLAASVAYCVTNALLLTLVLWLAQGIRPVAVLVQTIKPTAGAAVGYGLLGLAMAILWDVTGPLGAVLIVLPLVVARWTFDQYAQEQQAYDATIRALVRAVEEKDQYTQGHSVRVRAASEMIARQIGIGEERLIALGYASILHDIGKLGIPTNVLQKSGRLTEEEFQAIKRHPQQGQQLLSGIEFLNAEAFDGIQFHHERMDGFGYPAGLSGEAIPEFARVIAVADAFDSMTSTRSYRDARTVEDALAELERCKGTQFDPRMVEALVAALSKATWVPHTLEAGDPSAGAAFDEDDPAFSGGLR